jgi:hypothetical protein
MSSTAPGIYTTVTAAAPSQSQSAPTGNWFVTGITQQGPVGLPVPITSLTDYTNFLGARASESDSYNIQYNLYDALDEYFHDGGVIAYVSRVTGPAAGTATVSLFDNVSALSMTIRAAGPGAWGNNLSVIVSSGVNSSYNIQVLNAGAVVATSPALFAAVDAQVWFNSENIWQVEVAVTAGSGGVPVNGTFTLGSGSDDNASITDTQWTNALTAFTDAYGPGQVSAPGHTTVAGYESLTAHAYNFNRVAFLDVADSASASTLESQASSVQTGSATPDYAAMFAPWIIIPGLSSVNPNASSPVPNRVVPPSAFAAAVVAKSDQTNDTNAPAAGNNGQSSYAVGVTQAYVESDRSNLNVAGVDLVRVINTVVTLYGYRSLAVNPNWTYLNNVRFRMQVIYDFDQIGEGFVFKKIDGKGQLFSTFNGALAGKCQQYWVNNSVYGATADQAFAVNTGPQVNTSATIANNEINAVVSMIMSPFGEVVNINVVKFLTNATIPGALA